MGWLVGFNVILNTLCGKIIIGSSGNVRKIVHTNLPSFCTEIYRVQANNCQVAHFMSGLGFESMT